MRNIIIFLLVFSVIVVIHEWGHLYFAKRAGILVREFAIGMGTKLFSTRKNGTTYTIRALPLGGYVRLAGYGDEDITIQPGRTITIVRDAQDTVTTLSLNHKKPLLNGVPFEVTSCDLTKELFLSGRSLGSQDEVRFAVSPTATIIEADGTEVQIAPEAAQFQNASIKNRIMVNIAGPINNFILGMVVLTVVAFLNGGVQSERSLIGTIVDQSPAQQAGLQTGDLVIAVDGVTVNTFDEVASMVRERPARPVALDVLREDGGTISLTVTPEPVTLETGETIGRLGITPYFDESLWARLSFGITETWRLSRDIFSVLGKLLTQGFDINAFGGPVSIAATTSEVAEQGLRPLLYFVGFLSVNLGIMNLLPIPGLDGGKILLNLIEWVRGKPLSPEKENLVTLIGVGLLALLMIAVTWNDIVRHFFK